MKKILFLAAAAIGGLYLYNQYGKKTATDGTQTAITAENFGRNADGSLRPLTDIEADLYISKRTDMKGWFDAPENKQYEGDYSTDFKGWVKNLYWLTWGNIHDKIDDLSFSPLS